MNEFAQKNGTVLLWKRNNETIRVSPWGKDGVRIQSTMDHSIRNLPNALLDTPSSKTGPVHIDAKGEPAVLRNGKITVQLDANGRMRFLK